MRQDAAMLRNISHLIDVETADATVLADKEVCGTSLDGQCVGLQK